MIDTSRETDALVLEASDTQRLIVEGLRPQAVASTPALIVVDGCAIAVPLLLIGAAVLFTPATVDGRMGTAAKATGAGEAHCGPFT